MPGPKAPLQAGTIFRERSLGTIFGIHPLSGGKFRRSKPFAATDLRSTDTSEIDFLLKTGPLEVVVKQGVCVSARVHAREHACPHECVHVRVLLPYLTAGLFRTSS